jgi:hypothetical protein
VFHQTNASDDLDKYLEDALAMVEDGLPPQLVSDHVAQVYVIHQTGLVMLSRRYSFGCVGTEPQLIGGFLSALLTFANNSFNLEGNSCEWETDGIHTLKDIGMSCSRWFVKTIDNYTSAMLIPNQSPLLQNRKFDVIDNMCEQIITSFLIFQMFDINVDQNLAHVKDYSNDFGNTVDNIVYETLKDTAGSSILFEIGGEIEVNEILIQ